MEITIRDNGAIAKICKNTSLTPLELVESFEAALDFLYSTYEHGRNEGIEKRSFDQILAVLFRQVFKSSTINLDVAPGLIEQTNKLVGIEFSLSTSIYDVKLDFDNHSISYTILYSMCTDVAHLNAYVNLILQVNIMPEYIQVSLLDYIPLTQDVEIAQEDLKMLNDFLNHKLQEEYNIIEKESAPFSSRSISCNLCLLGSNPFDSRSKSHQFLLIQLDIRADKAKHVMSIEEIDSISKKDSRPDSSGTRTHVGCITIYIFTMNQVDALVNMVERMFSHDGWSFSLIHNCTGLSAFLTKSGGQRF